MRRKQKWAIRFEQGKNMGGETPLKFRSNEQVKGLGFGNRHHWCKMVNLMARHIDLIAPNHVLTTRPSQLSELAHTKTKVF